MEENSLFVYGLLLNKKALKIAEKDDEINKKLLDDISVFGDDERSKIITLHLYIEYWLNKLIKKKENIKNEKIDRDSFHKKNYYSLEFRGLRSINI